MKRALLLAALAGALLALPVQAEEEGRIIRVSMFEVDDRVDLLNLLIRMNPSREPIDLVMRDCLGLEYRYQLNRLEDAPSRSVPCPHPYMVCAGRSDLPGVTFLEQVDECWFVKFR